MIHPARQFWNSLKSLPDSLNFYCFLFTPDFASNNSWLKCVKSTPDIVEPAWLWELLRYEIEKGLRAVYPWYSLSYALHQEAERQWLKLVKNATPLQYVVASRQLENFRQNSQFGGTLNFSSQYILCLFIQCVFLTKPSLKMSVDCPPYQTLEV